MGLLCYLVRVKSTESLWVAYFFFTLIRPSDSVIDWLACVGIFWSIISNWWLTTWWRGFVTTIVCSWNLFDYIARMRLFPVQLFSEKNEIVLTYLPVQDTVMIVDAFFPIFVSFSMWHAFILELYPISWFLIQIYNGWYDLRFLVWTQCDTTF